MEDLPKDERELWEQDKRGQDERGQDERSQDKRGQDEREHDEKGQDEREQDEKEQDERGHNERGQDEKEQNERGQNGKGQNEKEQDEREQNKKGQDKKEQDERGQNEKGHDEKEQDKRGQNEKEQDEKEQNERGRNEKGQDEKEQDEKEQIMKNDEEYVRLLMENELRVMNDELYIDQLMVEANIQQNDEIYVDLLKEQEKQTMNDEIYVDLLLEQEKQTMNEKQYIRLQMEMGKMREEFLRAASLGQTEQLNILIEKGADIDYANQDGETALMLAALEGHLAATFLLLEKGCQKEATSNLGETALHMAAKNGHLEITRCLVEQGGVNPFVTTNQGKTPYDLAADPYYSPIYREVMQYLKTVMSKKSTSMTAELGIKDSLRSAMYNRLLGMGCYESFDMRCMVTGQFGTGKSSLVKLLAGVVIPEGRHPTDGISIVEGYCGIDMETRSWITIDPETYDAMDVVYNKVLMTSVEDDETPDKPLKHMSDEKAVGGQYKDNTKGDRSSQTKATKQPSAQQLEIPSLSTQSTSCESKRQQIKQNMKAKMTKDEIRKKMEKVLKSGKYKMKVGRLIFWDFGGQYVYYTTHQTFMTFRALFLVVFDGSKGLNEEVPDVLCFPGQHLTPTPAVFLMHWVNAILTYCKVVFEGIPKILFVATHKDKVPVEDVETRRALLYSEVEELFKDHEGRNHLVLDKQIFINATDQADQEIEFLKKAITDLTFDHPCWGEKMPNACVPLELEIAELVAQGKQILSLHEFEELNAISEVSVLNPRQLKNFLQFHHSLGKIVYFDSIHLRDYVIINPLLMVEVMRSFVTDRRFWPQKKRMQEIFREMSESGIICREDLYQIWTQNDFKAILPYKEFIFNILIHLDILAEQRRYDTYNGSRLPVEKFFVPCMVTERNTTSFMDKECTPERAICLAFVFKGTVIPSALPNRLISACLSMWTVKQYEGRKLIFSGFIVASIDKSHDIAVCVEGNKILLYLVHKTSAGLIVADIATGIKECLVLTMERISEFYQSTIDAKRSHQLPFHIEYSCSKLKCFIRAEEALQSTEWVCGEHKLTHRAGNWFVWNQDKKNDQCDEKCQGLSDDALNQKPSDIELLRFSINFPSNQMYQLVSYLNMFEKWNDITQNYPENIEVAKFLVLSKWREMEDGSNLKALAEALTNMDISTHVLCQVRRVRIAKTEIPLEYLDFIPTEGILDALAPQIGQVFFQLGAEVGLSIGTLENIKSNNPRDLAAQNREVLFAWREDRTVKPTIRVLVQALVNVGRGALCLQEVLKSVDLNTLGHSSDMGAIPKKPQGQKERTSKRCAIV